MFGSPRTVTAALCNFPSRVVKRNKHLNVRSGTVSSSKFLPGIGTNFASNKSPSFKVNHGNVRGCSSSSSSSHLTEIQLTVDRFTVSEPKGVKYGKVGEEDVHFFQNLLDKNRVLTEESEVIGYNVDWLHMVRGSSRLVLRPKTTEEVSAILKYCNERRLPVCPQAGNTGLVGGSVPVRDEIVVSTSLMNNVLSLDELTGTLVCQAGCVLEFLTNYLSERGFIMPLDLGAKGSCQIGGNVSTNAGGLRLVRYGSLHSTVFGLEVVLADGEIVDCLSTMKKDNTGYDLKHLFIGSEGTLGFVTKVAIAVPVKPNSVQLALLGLNSFTDVLETFKLAKREVGEILSSIEYMDKVSMECVTENLNLKNPIKDFPFYMLIETSGSNESHDQEKLNGFLDKVLSNGLVVDGTVAADGKQMLEIWALRERTAEALMADGFLYTYDISLPIPTFNDIVLDLDKRVKVDGGEALRVCGFGHLGDGNLHLNVSSKKFSTDLLHKIEPFVYDWTAGQKGSVSAEHGLGFKKKQFIFLSKSSTAIEKMRELKKIFDPNQILNPYKVLPETD